MNRDSSNQELKAESLTDQIFEDFRGRLLATGKFDASATEQLLGIARAGTKPKAKDIENIFRPKDIIE